MPVVSTTAFCGIDVGTQGVRAVVVTSDGRPLGHGAAATPSSRTADGRHEQLAEDWWAAVTAAVTGAVEQARHRDAGIGITAVALDATSGTVLVEDADGTASGPALMYDDARAAEQLARVDAAGHELWDALG